MQYEESLSWWTNIETQEADMLTLFQNEVTLHPQLSSLVSSIRSEVEIVTLEIESDFRV